MSTIRLADHKFTGKQFLLDDQTGQVGFEHCRSREESLAFCAGFGTWATQFRNWRLRSIFVAMYVQRPNVLIWIDGKRFTVTPETKGTVSSYYPLKIFSLWEEKEELINFKFVPWAWEDDDDISWFIEERTKSAHEKKWFIYMWAAHAEGRQRAIPTNGWPEELMRKVKDPWDTSIDVT